MNEAQKNVLKVAGAAILGMLIYPPFQAFLGKGVITNMGYSWIFDPPELGTSSIVGTVNHLQLLIQWVGVLIIAGLAFIAFRGKS